MKPNCANNYTREVEFGLLNGGEDGEHTGDGFLEVSKIFAMQSAIFFVGIISFDELYQFSCTL